MDEAENHPVHYKLAMYLWEFTIPRIHYYSREVLRQKGFAGNYSGEGLQKLMKERMIVSGTLLEIARHHAEDHEPQLCNPRDSVKMYEIICEHLENCSRRISRNSNLGDVPMDDLRALSDLSRDLFPVASQFAPKLGEDKRISRFRRLSGRREVDGTVQGFRGLRRKVRDEELRDQEEIPVDQLNTRLKHNPIIDSIERYVELNARDRSKEDDRDE